MKGLNTLCVVVAFYAIVSGATDRIEIELTDWCTNPCSCTRNNGNTWLSLTYNCQYGNITELATDLTTLRPNVENLILSWNCFKFVPRITSESLRLFDLMENEIIELDETMFEALPMLIDLNLSWNRIEAISMNAFQGLKSLKFLNLAGNRLNVLSSNIFSHLNSLEHLILSHNVRLNETFESPDIDLFVSLGVTTMLKVVEVNNCSLRHIDLSQGVNLEEIQLRSNDFLQTPNIPLQVSTLDLSRNPFVTISAKFLPHLPELRSLVLEDMNRLSRIEDFAFVDLPNLKELNIQNCWNLTHFSALAFGDAEYLKKTDFNLTTLNLRGGFLTTLNSTLLPVFLSIEKVDLFGNPFICDCNVEWLKAVTETNAVCVVPKSLRGQFISEIDEDRLECVRWPSWLVRTMNGLLVLLLLLLCGAATWLVVMGLRPSRRDVLQKIGAHSPYARVTIQPNQAEYN